MVDQCLTSDLGVPLRVEFQEYRWEDAILTGKELSSFLLDLEI